MSIPAAEIDACAASHERLHQSVRRLDEAAFRRKSRLPGWTVGHVVTHLARNADSVVRRIDAVVDGRIVDQYEGGPPARAAAIEAGADRVRPELIADLERSDAAVDALFRSLAAEVWEQPFARPEVSRHPAGFLVFMRWREVEVHHVDLGIGYEPANWPDALVDRWLPSLLEDVTGRADRRALMAWCLGRGAAPELAGWD
jgi:maleylpyruvate isomerase